MKIGLACGTDKLDLGFYLVPDNVDGVFLKVKSPKSEWDYNIIRIKSDGTVVACSGVEESLGLPVDEIGKVKIV